MDMADLSNEDATSGKMQFKILRSTASVGPRLGRLSMRSRHSIDTPHYIGITSRGVLPHLSQDVMQKHTAIKGVYVAVEDFVEHSLTGKTPPVLSNAHDGNRRPSFRDFVSLPDSQLLVVGARRADPLVTPWPNQQTGISISTAFGFSRLNVDEYVNTVQSLKPDIVVALGDIPLGKQAGRRRIEKMSGRTEKWVKEILDSAEKGGEGMEGSMSGKIFAPVLPVPKEQQSLYLEILADDWKPAISGLAIFDDTSPMELPESLLGLPILSLTGLKTPSQILKEVSRNVDIFTAPFIGEATDSGIALDFTFPAEKTGGSKKALAIDMWASQHAADLSPLVDQCDCYACSAHHRAYIHHLLQAKEMLAWVLLQIHNIRIMDKFFAGIRGSIAQGTFDNDHEAFLETYEAELPQTDGLGPRLRGYQFKSEGPGESRRNPKAYNTLDGAHSKQQNAEAPLPSPGADAEELEAHGLGEVERR